MTTDLSGLTRLLMWVSPAFPTGGFAWSHGLEWAVESGDIKDGETLRLWLSGVIVHGAGRNDTILLRHAHRAWNDPATLRVLAALALATATSRERRDESLAQGRAFLKAASAWDVPETPEDMPHALALGVMAGAHGIAENDAAAAWLQNFTTALISAAVRLVPLGQTAGLRVLAALEPVMLGVVLTTREASLDDLGGCAFRSDIAAMRHETQYTRLFRS